MRSEIKFGLVFATTALAATAALPVVNANADTKKTVTVGVVGDTSRELWEDIGQRAQKKYGIKIK